MPFLTHILGIVKVLLKIFSTLNMQQLELFDFRRDYLFNNKNQIAHWYDILKESKDTISYAEHIDPKKGYAIGGMEYEEYGRKEG